MTDYLADDLLPLLLDDDRVEAATADADGLILRIDGELLRVARDRDHGRTVCWGEVRRLSPGDDGGGAAAAMRYNGGAGSDAGLTMGLNRARNALILGRSIDAEEIGAEAAVQAALRVRGALHDARALLDAVLEDARATQDKPFDAAGDAPLIRA